MKDFFKKEKHSRMSAFLVSMAIRRQRQMCIRDRPFLVQFQSH